jgi:hypothetical protein
MATNAPKTKQCNFAMLAVRGGCGGGDGGRRNSATTMVGNPFFGQLCNNDPQFSLSADAILHQTLDFVQQTRGVVAPERVF